MASDILSYNVVQDHEGISIKGYRGLRPQGDLIYSDLSVLGWFWTGFVRGGLRPGRTKAVTRSVL